MPAPRKAVLLQLYLAGLVIFTGASMLCGFAVKCARTDPAQLAAGP